MNLTGIFSVFKAGRSVANPAAWKQHQVTANMVAAVLSFALSLLKGTRYDPHMDDATVLLIAGGVFGVVNWLFTVATSDKVGVFGQPAKPAAVVAGAAGDPAPVGEPHADAPVGGVAAVAPAPDAVRLQPGTASNPDNYLPG